MKKRLLSLLLTVLVLTTTLFVSSCDIRGWVDELISVINPEETTTEPEKITPPTPSVFDGIEFSDPAEVIPAAYALATNAAMEGTWTLKGKITEADAFNADSNDMCVTIVVDGYESYPIYCYYLKNCTADVGLGDYVAVRGKIKNYSGKVEFDKPELLAYENGVLLPSIDIEPKPGTGLAEGYNVITVQQALEIAKFYGDETTRYYILATISNISNAQYGSMYIEDETGSISVYGTYSEDGSLGYASMTDKPGKGDKVLLACTLHTFNGKAEVQNARLIKFEKAVIDENAYTQMSIADARNAAKGTNVKITGVVAQITYASGLVPNGIYLVDGTNSIYIYDNEVASSVKVGNKITVIGEKDWWILEDEVSSAEKHGYKGCNQITKARVLENDQGTSEPDYSWVTETTVKEILDTPFTNDITTTIYKVTALVKKQEGTGFFNVYFNDLDGVTGSYVYTQCNGNDLNWIAPYYNKICTVYLSVINAKSTSTGCVWRFKAIEIIDEGFTFDTANAPEFALDYFALPKFETKYTADPALELITSVSSELLGFEGVTISYSSDNTGIVYFETVNGKTVMHCGNMRGKATVTVTATYNGVTATKTIVVENAEPIQIDYISVADAITVADETTVVVKGIVGPSVVNKDGFYLFGEDGSMIAVIVKDLDQFAGLNIGDEIILTGKREQYINPTKNVERVGQSCIVGATILANYYGDHEYSTEKFITDATIKQVYDLKAMEDHSTEVYVLTGTLYVPTSNRETVSLSDANGNKITFYHSSPAQYSFLTEYSGQTVTLEVAPCNWNDKAYWRGCAIAIVLPDGTKILNELNFN